MSRFLCHAGCRTESARHPVCPDSLRSYGIPHEERVGTARAERIGKGPIGTSPKGDDSSAAHLRHKPPGCLACLGHKRESTASPAMWPLIRRTECVLEMCVARLGHGACLRVLASPFLFVNRGRGTEGDRNENWPLGQRTMIQIASPPRLHRGWPAMTAGGGVMGSRVSGSLFALSAGGARPDVRGDPRPQL